MPALAAGAAEGGGPISGRPGPRSVDETERNSDRVVRSLAAVGPARTRWGAGRPSRRLRIGVITGGWATERSRTGYISILTAIE